MNQILYRQYQPVSSEKATGVVMVVENHPPFWVVIVGRSQEQKTDLLHEVKKQFEKSTESLVFARKILNAGVGGEEVIIAVTNGSDLALVASKPKQILLFVQEKLHRVTVSSSGVVGKVAAGDRVVLSLDSVLNLSLNDVATLFYFTHQSKDNELQSSHMPGGGVVFEVVKKKKSPVTIATIKKWLKKMKLPSLPFTNKPPSLPAMVVSSPYLRSKRRRFALTLALLFMAFLTVSVGIGIHKRKQFEQEQAMSQLIETVSYRLEQAASLKNLNPARAKTLLAEARLSLDEYRQTTQLPEEAVVELEHKVALAFEEVAGQKIVVQAEVFYDPSLLKEGLQPTQMILSEDELTIVDPQNKLLAQVNVETKAARLVAGQSLIPSNPKTGAIPAWAFLYSSGKLQILDKQFGEQVKSFVLNTIYVDRLVGYGNNAYVLDVGAGQVWRMRGVEDGLAKPEGFFNEERDLEGAVDMAVDGSVWLLYGNGGVEKYTSGVIDAFFPEFGLDKPLNNPVSLFTDENQEHMYIFDKNNARVVAVTKKGEFWAEYVWDELAQADAIVAYEKTGKLLALIGGKIYAIDLKQ